MADNKLLNKYVLLKIIIQEVVRLLDNQLINIRHIGPAKVDVVSWVWVLRALKHTKQTRNETRWVYVICFLISAITFNLF